MKGLVERLLRNGRNSGIRRMKGSRMEGGKEGLMWIKGGIDVDEGTGSRAVDQGSV